MYILLWMDGIVNVKLAFPGNMAVHYLNKDQCNFLHLIVIAFYKYQYTEYVTTLLLGIYDFSTRTWYFGIHSTAYC